MVSLRRKRDGGRKRGRKGATNQAAE